MWKKMAQIPSTTVKLEAFLARGKRVITPLVTFCAVTAIALGIVWMFVRKDILLFASLGFSSCYLIGRNSPRFRSRDTCSALIE